MITTIAIALLRELKVPFTERFVRERTTTMPFNESLYGFAAFLALYDISAQCVRFTDKEAVKEVEMPCVVLYRGKFAVMTKWGVAGITLLFEEGKPQRISADEFEKNWDGTAMLVSANSHSGEPDYAAHRRDDMRRSVKHYAAMAAAAIIAVMAIAWGGGAASWMWWGAIAVNVAGGYVAWLLLGKELHIPNKVADRLCGLAKESHCEDVTQSEGGTLFGLVRLSEVGAAFFGVNLLTLVFRPESVGALAIVAMAVLPFSFWSIWYQKVKARSWCVLCLCTLAAMWLQAGVYLVGGVYSDVELEWSDLTVLCCAYLLAVVAINRAMEIAEKLRDADRLKFSYNSLRMEDKVMKVFWEDGAMCNTATDTCSALIFGNPDAQRVLTLFSNPYCGPCGTMHEHIHHLPGDNVAVRYVMTFFSEERAIINRYFIATYLQLGAEKTWELMTQWHAGGKERNEQFFDGMGLDPYAEAVTAEFEKHNAWPDRSKLRGTPTAIYHNRVIPDLYDVTEYMYLPQTS